MNFVFLIGRLTTDPELRYTVEGKPRATFTLAVDRPYKNREGEKEADFIPVVVWGGQAENCAEYLDKGRLVAVSGVLQIRTYTTESGQKKKVFEVVAGRIKFLDWKQRSVQEELEYDDDIPF